MLLFLISSISITLLCKPFLLWVSEMKFLFIGFWGELLGHSLSLLEETWFTNIWFLVPPARSMKKCFRSKVENVEETDECTLLDLPELALECILEKLPPSELCKLTEVCKSFRDRCRSDHLWKRHMKEKWGRVIGDAAYKHWKLYTTSIKDYPILERNKKKSLIKSLSCVCSSTAWVRNKYNNGTKEKTDLPIDSVMSLYLYLESGKFWFPAQVYNREHGHVGFMMSCYDAELSYDSFTHTFQARYPPHGPRLPVIEEAVKWNRIRAPPVGTDSHNLHVSDCLNDLHPGDHIEIQWRRNQEFPYGWWYGVVGHLESCNKNHYLCSCHSSDNVVLEFNQYTPGSRWRQAIVDRKGHREKGNETDGFYGGIRKLSSKEEISVWKNMWPKDILQ